MIVLPRTTKEGKPRISYSQIKMWNSLKAFNYKAEGALEYMIEYFYGETSEDSGWGQFGKEVEAYIGERVGGESFSQAEKDTLEKIEPLGVLSDEFEIDFVDFAVTGIIDDRSADWAKIRDYKTASHNSKKQYYKPDYIQLSVYALAALEEHGIIPQTEVCIIERKGRVFGKGRAGLTVGGEIWYVDKTPSIQDLHDLKNNICRTVKQISDYYKMFLKINE